MSNRTFFLTPTLLLRAYAAGIFPMADDAQSTELHWFDPPVRAIIPLDPDRFHVSRRLKRTLHQKPYDVRLNTSFQAVIEACAAPAPGREKTWINQEIRDLYRRLHERGSAHSVEVFQDEKLVGGLYGVSLGGAFFGESMFSRAENASKIALVYLVTLLHSCAFTLLDTQFQTDHLTQFGTTEITRANYQLLLKSAIEKKRTLTLPKEQSWDQLVEVFLQPVTQRS